MTRTPALRDKGEPTLGEPTLDEMRARPPEEIDEEWKDDIVNRLLRELKRQLSQLENTKPTTGIDQHNIRNANMSTLAAIERTLERMLRIEQQRELARETRMTLVNDGARAALERRLDQLLAATQALPAPEKSER